MTEPAKDLRERLQASLGDAFVIERELGGGGMGRVFLAREVALGRYVVVKVLRPEYGGVSVGRFRREIHLAAQLQHPHIVPVHITGETAGLLYYTMPFIEGESLRERLAGGKRIPIADVCHVLHDVIDALRYAHERGVVHRDIKPDNVLMSGSHAVVVDFGVAKALHDAKLGERRPSDTDSGMAIGTPAYMAPEQAAGDPSIDQRADIYAFGLLAYELLSGKSPFWDRPPERMLAAQVAEQPRPIAEVREDTPPALAALVMRCLEKSPADRPQTAVEVQRELQSIATPGSGLAAAALPERRAGRLVAFAAAAALLVVAGVGAMLWRGRTRQLNEGVVAVVPFRVTNGDPSLRYLREGMLDLFAAKLTGEGGPRSADPRSLLNAWHRAAGSDTADLPRERALDVAEDVGAGRLLLGDIGGTADRLVLNAVLLRVRDGRAEAQARVEGPADSLPQLVDRLTAQLLALGAGEGERLSSLTSTSLPALKAYLGGQWLYRHGRYRDASKEFERALQFDSTFALAALGLATTSGWFGDPVAGYRGLQIAWRSRDRLSERDRALLASTAGPNFPGPSTYAELLKAKEHYLALATERPEAWYEYGDGLFHYGRVVGIADAHERAADAFRRAIALDSTFSPAIEHLVMLDAHAGDTASVRRLGERFAANDSASENLDGVRWRVAAAVGDSAALARIAARRATLTPAAAHTIENISQLEGADLDHAEQVMAQTLVRPGSRIERFSNLISAHDMALNRGHPGRALTLTEMYRDLQQTPNVRAEVRERVRDALFWDGDSLAAVAAARQLERDVEEPMPASLNDRAVWYADICTLELWRLAHGDTRTAHQSIEQLRAAAHLPDSAALGPFAVRCAVLLDASLASAEQRADAAVAVARLDSLLRTGPGGVVQDAGNLVLARLQERAGNVGAALSTVRRREYFFNRTAFLSTYLREEGRLAALSGDTLGAIAAYRHYLALRATPDPELKPDTESITRELWRLEREMGGRREN